MLKKNLFLIFSLFLYAEFAMSQETEIPQRQFLYRILSEKEVKAGIADVKCQNEYMYQQLYRNYADTPLAKDAINNRDLNGECQFYLYDFKKQAGTRIKNEDIAKLTMTDGLEHMSDDGWRLETMCYTNNTPTPCAVKGSQIIPVDVGRILPNYEFLGWMTTDPKKAFNAVIQKAPSR